MTARRYDAVVVGARVAGASTAMLLARAGLDVLLVDRAGPGADTLSTHALLRPAIVQLERWGVLDAVVAAGTPAITRSEFVYGGDAVAVPVEPAVYAPRRTVLDRALVDAARAAGVEVRHRVAFAGARRDRAGRVAGAVLAAGRSQAEVACDVLVGADGAWSSVARAVGSTTYRIGVTEGGSSVFAYVTGIDPHAYRWSFAPEASAGAIPTNDGLACVFAAVRPRRFRAEIRGDAAGSWRRIVREVDPELAEAAAAGEVVGRFRTFPGRRSFFRNAAGPGWALVGDAGHYLDPSTAHGMTGALRDAELLARAVVGGRLASFQDERDALAEGVFAATMPIASFDWDLEMLRLHHRRLSEVLRDETAFVSSWPPLRAGRAA